jgi:hypothetical protein
VDSGLNFSPKLPKDIDWDFASCTFTPYPLVLFLESSQKIKEFLNFI